MVTYGVVVVFSAFMIQVVTFGIATSIGMYNIELLEYYGASAATTSMIGSINIGVFLGGGPLASFLMSKISFRKVALLGAFLSSFGLICIPFAPNIIFINIFYGVFTGLGFCFLYIPSSVLAGLYFESRRSLATGIAQAGYGLGGLIFPFLVHQLIDEFGWKGSMFIVNGINIQNFVFAALLRPIERPSFPKAAYLSVGERESILKRDSDDTTSRIPNTMPVTIEERGLMIQKGSVEAKNTKVTQKLSVKDLIRQRSVTQINNLAVLLDFAFIVYFINNILWNFGTGIIVVLGPELFKELGLEKKNVAISFTLCGVGALFGSVTGGLIGNWKVVNRLVLYTFSNILLGCFVFMLIIQSFQTFIGLSIVNMLWSLCFGVVLGLLVVVTDDILGTPLLGVGMGYIMLANGVGNIAGPPVAGWLRDTYGTYYESVCLAGGTLIASGCLMLLIPLYKYTKQRKSDRDHVVL